MPERPEPKAPKTRKKNPTPCVFQRGKTWTCIYFIDDPKTGRRKQKWKGGFKTKAEARAARTELQAQADKGLVVTSYGNLPFRDYADKFLEWNKRTMRPNTVANYTRVIGSLTDEIDRKPMKAITPDDIGRVYETISGKGYAEQTTYSYMARVRTVFNFAVRHGDILVNPFLRVSFPAPRKKRRPAPSVEEIQALLHASAGSPVYTPILLAFTLGLREGEVCGLRFDDFDFERGTVHIQRQVARCYDENREVHVAVTDLKTESSDRILRVPRVTQEHVQRLMEIRDDLEKYPYVVKGGDKAYLQPNSIAAQYVKIRDSLGLTTRFHDIRHGFGTVCQQYGVPLNVIKDAMGHTDIKTTAEIYIDTTEMMNLPANAIDAVFDAALEER